jgi:ABC-type antimicrobial peptide transport system permease subunit
MRSLGVSKRKSFLIVFTESFVLVMIGSLLGLLPAGIVAPIRIEAAGIVLFGFLIFYMLGNFIALILLNRFSVMAILSKAD